jgi:UBA-like domain
MAGQPSPDDLRQFKDITCCGDDKLAITFLQRNNYDVTSAIGEYYEDSTRYDKVGPLPLSAPGL